MIAFRREQFEQLRARQRQHLPGKLHRSLVAQGIRAELRERALVVKDKLSNETLLSFRADGLPESLTRASGLGYRFDYDGEGRLSQIGYPSGRRLQFEHDDAGQVVAVDQPGLASYMFEYAPQGPVAALASVVYPDGRRRSFEHDSAGRVSACVEPSGAAYEFERDAQGQLVAKVDPLGRATEWVTDERGDLAGVRFPDGSAEAYLFDEEAQTAVRLMRDGSETHYRFDVQGRLSHLVNGPDKVTEFTYDDEDRLSSVESPEGRIGFLNQGDVTVREESAEGRVSYGYDAEQRLTSLTTPFGETVRYDYDADGRLTSLLDWNGRRVSFEWDAEDLCSALHFPQGLEVRQDHGLSLRPTRRWIGRSGTVIQDLRYQYDDCSRFTGALDVGLDGSSQRVSYDDDDRVLSETIDECQSDYVYDAKGNLIQAGSTRILVGLMDEPLLVGDSRIVYDARGNMVDLPGAGGRLSCSYAQDGMLVACRGSAGAVIFRYDALGRRIEKRSEGRIWRYGWSGQQLLWEEFRSAENATPQRRDYLIVPGLPAPLGFREQGRMYWMLTDVRGAVDLVLDEQGQVAWQARYDSFGRVDVQVNRVRQPWRLQGQYADEETGLCYNFARYYSPELRSFLSLDPRWVELEASHYSLCRNDPWNRADPTGGLGPLLVIGVAGVVGAVVGAATAAVTGGDPLAGAVEGAVGGAGAVVAVVAGASAAAVVAAGVVATAAGALAGSLVQQIRKSDKFSVKCALLAAGTAALTDLFLLGLGRIPGVKPLGKALGKKLSKLLKPLKKFAKGKLNQIKGRLQQIKGRLLGNTKATRQARKQAQASERLAKKLVREAEADEAVRRGLAESKDALLRNPTGITSKHRRVFRQQAVKNDRVYFVRAGNADSVKYQGLPGYTAKDVTCKAKTAKFGPNAGLVVNPTHRKQAAFWDAAERAAANDPEKLAKIRGDRKKAVESWREFEAELKSPGTEYSVNADGLVLQNRKKIHGDYDLHGVYDDHASKKSKIDHGSGKKGAADTEAAARRKELNEALGSEQIKHGGQDDWVPKAGKTIEADPPVVAFMPDGSEVVLNNADDMKLFYKNNGIPWPYPKTGT